MQKRGQVTVFIVLGIIIMAVFALTAFLLKSGETSSETLTQPVQTVDELKIPVKQQVEGCLDQTATKAIHYVSLQGGYYNPPPVYQYQFGAFIPYYYYDNKVNLPTISEIETELGNAIKDFLPKCLDPAKDFFFNDGIIVNYEIKEVVVRLTSTATIVEANIPTTITLKGMVSSSSQTESEIVYLGALNSQTTLTEMTNYLVENKVPYARVYDLAKEIVQIQSQYPLALPLKSITTKSIENHIGYKLIPVKTVLGEGEEYDEKIEPDNVSDDRNGIIFALVDQDVFNKPYYFTFGISYDVNYDQKFASEIALEEKAKIKMGGSVKK